ncbi:aromatic acid exporter family protein [Micromonospora craniellae]|uniref:Aromatic acid exporter family protein n=1 Tax=Micromonospora craniellae TaxID=2294034 RepID=A0A372FWU6_9ACTN|nr:FUSC family protein [Micromonospora craniellae]QOC95124.1 FUSC family protein [Micromonospora craniellae]RFS45272.1 aromatic acid exporter family protein [Micromonospora craniellae]
MAVARDRRFTLLRGNSRRSSLSDVDTQRIAETVAQLHHRGKATLRDRLHRVRMSLALALQAGLAAGLAWVAAHELLGNPQPVFAPISAVGTLAVSLGQRFRRTAELIIGVGVGVFVGDLLVHFLGTGPWQLALIVTSAILLTIFAGGSVAIVIQAAATAVLIATLSPSVEDLEIPRFIDALVGGSIALLVTAVLLPLNPLRVLNRAARPALDLLAEQLDHTADGLRDREQTKIQQALDRLRNNKEELTALTDAIEGAKETALLSPARWHRRSELTHYAEAAEPIDRAMRNSGTLIRRAVTLVEDEEPVPAPMPDAVAHLAESVRLLKKEFAQGEEPEQARERSLRAVSEAGRAYAEGVGFSGSVVVAQVRTTASDLMVASGISQEEANRLVRQSFGELDRPGVRGGPEPAAKAPTAPPVG